MYGYLWSLGRFLNSLVSEVEGGCFEDFFLEACLVGWLGRWWRFFDVLAPRIVSFFELRCQGGAVVLSWWGRVRR